MRWNYDARLKKGEMLKTEYERRRSIMVKTINHSRGPGNGCLAAANNIPYIRVYVCMCTRQKHRRDRIASYCSRPLPPNLKRPASFFSTRRLGRRA